MSSSSKPSRSSYFPLPQQSSDLEPSEAGSPISHPPRQSSSSQRSLNPTTTAAHVDLLFRRWTATIAKKIRLKRANKGLLNLGKRAEEKEIMASVFEVWEKEVDNGVAFGEWRTLDHQDPMSKEQFTEIVNQVLAAITSNVQPRLNSKGSSGSYFAKDSSGKTVGIFKPKDEEVRFSSLLTRIAYGRLNPKFTKWIHREFLSKVIPFGRACLIPAQSYLSEAAASLLDRRLESNIVPRTEIVGLSSPAFFYDWIDRERAKKRGTWREKLGSLQVFLLGYTDASDFLRSHPYPGRPLSQTLDTTPHRTRRINPFSPLKWICGRADAEGDDSDDEGVGGWGWGGEDGGLAGDRERERGFKWTETLMESFRVELEKLVVLDFIMRNTDRGLDNMMIKACTSPECELPPGSATASAPPPRSPMSEVHRPQPIPSPSLPTSNASNSASPSSDFRPHVHVAAIDNSLSFPHQHPRGWRSFSYGWLYLPVSLIGQPWSQSTRDHFLPLLSNPRWWSRTVWELKELFKQDEDFDEKMFRKQMAVMKGQGWNVVQSLLNEDEGPLELCRRQKKLVWDDFIEVADDEMTRSIIASTAAPPSRSDDVLPPSSPPLTPRPTSRPVTPTTKRTPSITDQPTPASLPVPLKRVSSDRPRRPKATSRYSHSRLAQSISSTMEVGSLTGLDLMKHLDRMEAEERDVGHSFGTRHANDGEEDDDDDQESQWGVQSESDVRPSSTTSPPHSARDWKDKVRATLSFDLDRSTGSDKSPNLGMARGRNRSGSLTSLSRGRGGNVGRGGRRAQNQSSIADIGEEAEWLGGLEDDVEDEGEIKKKVVVVERMETVEEKSRFSGLC